MPSKIDELHVTRLREILPSRVTNSHVSASKSTQNFVRNMGPGRVQGGSQAEFPMQMQMMMQQMMQWMQGMQGGMQMQGMQGGTQPACNIRYMANNGTDIKQGMLVDRNMRRQSPLMLGDGLVSDSPRTDSESQGSAENLEVVMARWHSPSLI